MTEPIKALQEYLATIDDISQAASLLSWDQLTYMPPKGAEARANQLTTLSRLSHEYSTSKQLGQLIDAAETALTPDDNISAALVRVARRNYDRNCKLPTELVAELTHTAVLGNEVWEQARAATDFKLFAPQLEHTFELQRQVAEHLGYQEHPYDALLDQYEPGMTTRQVQSLFEELQAGLVPLVAAIAPRHQATDDQPLHQPFDPDQQLAWGWKIVTGWGFDPEAGRQDQTVHPFCTSFSPHDVRITTRVYPDFLSPALFGTMHETGHALYEQGINPAFSRGPLGAPASLGVHESQSRLWENLVGRSPTFWSKHYEDLQATFPQLKSTSFDRFVKAVNTVQPSTIRVEADELTYNLHILLRFEMETALLTGNLAVKDVPEAWNARMQSLLGITPPDDSEGVLQDVHWSGGSVGYFPTYTIGNVLSVQLWEAAQRDDPAMGTELARAKYGKLLHWLREHVHQYGAMELPNDLIQRATGEPLTAKPYLNYLKTKFTALYGLPLTD
ncbi:MAG: carboxypeptidase M32 [Herpetosiphonaceae bacterium]|nr:carboxypeptidase M32 [Herpetosiphonaceae bacterium]